MRTTLSSAGGSDLAGALDAPTYDELMAQSRREALAWAGDDVGSPVTVWDLGDYRRGFFGPVVAPEPEARSDALWDAVVNAATVPEFFDLKARPTKHPYPRVSPMTPADTIRSVGRPGPTDRAPMVAEGVNQPGIAHLERPSMPTTQAWFVGPAVGVLLRLTPNAGWVGAIIRNDQQRRTP